LVTIQPGIARLAIFAKRGHRFTGMRGQFAKARM
jgi:hypothetical protein